MYGKLGSTALLAVPAGVFASGGLGTLWLVVAACTLLAAGCALARLVPRRER